MSNVIENHILEFQEINPAVEISKKPIVVVDDGLIEWTMSRALKAPQRRARILLHTNITETLHEMLIVLPQESCDVPHINKKSGKSFHLLKGEMVVMIFSDDGQCVTPFRLKADSNSYPRMVRLSAPYWHTIIPISGPVVFIETISGPFIGNQFAPWAQGKKARGTWTEKLRKIANSGLNETQQISFEESIEC